MNTLSGSIGCSNETYYVTLDMIHSFKIAIFFCAQQSKRRRQSQTDSCITCSNRVAKKNTVSLCTFENASYETLTKEIGRGRTTILESMESLIRHRYVEKQKVLSL